jgi:hypothetical protein
MVSPNPFFMEPKTAGFAAGDGFNRLVYRPCWGASFGNTIILQSQQFEFIELLQLSLIITAAMEPHFCDFGVGTV